MSIDAVIESVERDAGGTAVIGLAARDPDAHVWRLPHPGEPREEGGVCVKYGAYANSEAELPCRPDDPAWCR